MKFKHYQTKAKFLTDLGDSKINNGDLCYIKDTQEIYTHGQYYRGCLSDYAQNDSTQPDFIKNRTHYVEISTSSVWNQTGCTVGSGTTSPGGYPATFNITTGNKYNVTISQGSNSKTYEGLTAAYDSVFNGLALRKNWSDSMGMSDTSTDALLLVVQPSNVVLRSADIYGENCTVQVSEVTETIHKLDPKYLPDNVNQLESVTTSKSGKVTTVTFEQTNGTETQFQVNDGADGTNGKSAYQVAVDNGYSGTEAQWLASLKGADGVSLGEVELTQEVTTATDSVPANKAVYDKVQRLTETDIEDILATGEAKEPTLPTGYTELEWIYNENGSSGIDTGLIPNDANWRFVGSWARMKTVGANYVAIFRAYAAEGYNTYRIISYGNSNSQILVYNHCVTSAGKTITLSNTGVDVWHTFDLSYGSITLDGTTTSLNTTQGTTNTATLKLINGSYYARFKTFKAYHNNVLVGNFVPAKRDSDGEIGMYDTITNTFFEHINSNSLVGGPVVAAGKDKILNGEGLSNAIATNFENPNKLPTVQVVKDGIEVWRDEVDYIYKANDLTFDGSNYVDTGWNPYNPEGDFYIKIEISDLDLTGMAASGIIISCVKQLTPYPGFVIRKASDTTINVWLDGVSRWPTTVNTRTGSKNTIIFKRKGNVYTFQVNGGTENTFTSTTDNTNALNLYIGSGLDANNNLWRFGKFHLDSLEIKSLEQNTQLYGDYTKDVKIYPKTTIENVKGLPSQLNNISFGAGWSTPAGTLYFKLSPAQVEKLNQTDGITIFTSAKITNGNQYNYRYVTFFQARKYASNNYSTADTNGLRITTTFSNRLIVNGVTLTKDLLFMNLAIEINKKLGRVRIWNEGYLVEESFNDAFKTDYFIDSDGVFTFGRGDYDQIWYNYQLYSGEIITDWKRTDPFKVIGASTPAKAFVDGFDSENFSDPYVFGASLNNYASNRYYRVLKGATVTIGPDSTYADFVNTGAATDALGGSNPFAGRNGLTISITPFDVNEGTFKAYKDKPAGMGTVEGSAYVYYRNQDGTQGDEIEDYNNIGQGQYLFVGNNFGVYTSPYLTQVAYPSSIRVYPKTFIFVGCVLDVRMDILYNNRFKDYVSNEDFIMYSNNTLTTEFVPDITTEKADALIDTNFSLSKFPGRMSMHDNNVYMLVHNPTTGAYTWKQLNNS